MASWTLEDIHWEKLDRNKVNSELLSLVKAASLVEQNGADYAQYLNGVFQGDPEFQRLAGRWGNEETQHGQALGRWATLVDPSFDHHAASTRFTEGFRVDLDAASSVRGSRAGELVARCIVETGTSSFYAALGEATEEPVLKEICRHIAADELRHYKLFYSHLKRYLLADGIGMLGRMKIAVGRIAESSDDELAYAFYAANENDAPYERRRCVRAYVRSAYSIYRWHHVHRGMAMIFKTVGLKPHGRFSLLVARLAWWGIQRRLGWLTKAAA